MDRFVGKIEYVGGEVVEFTAGNRALAEWEKYALRHKYPMGKDAPAMLSSLVIAHFVLGIEQPFDAWCDTVESAELDYTDPKSSAAADAAPDVPPTPSEASPE